MSRPIEVRELTMEYSEVRALDNVTLRVEKGELVTVLGPSGCGKSTLLSLISGLRKATAGQIYLGEERIDHLPPQQREIGFLFQNYALFPSMNVYENLAFGLRIRKYSRIEINRQVEELLEMLGLTDQAHKKPAHLSGGQQQRVALGRALAPKPNVLLLDEPLSALDVQIRQRLREELRNLQRNLGITTILVTHDQEEAFELGDRVAVMNKGKIEQVDIPQRIYDFPATEFVACFVGNVNVLSGVVSSGKIYSCSLAMDLPDYLKGTLNNTPVRIYIRPENFILEKETNATAKGAIRGVIRSAVFRGALIGLDILLDNAEVIHAVVTKDKTSSKGLFPGVRVVVWAKASHVVSTQTAPACVKAG